MAKTVSAGRICFTIHWMVWPYVFVIEKASCLTSQPFPLWVDVFTQLLLPCLSLTVHPFSHLFTFFGACIYIVVIYPERLRVSAFNRNIARLDNHISQAQKGGKKDIIIIFNICFISLCSTGIHTTNIPLIRLCVCVSRFPEWLYGNEICYAWPPRDLLVDA